MGIKVGLPLCGKSIHQKCVGETDTQKSGHNREKVTERWKSMLRICKFTICSTYNLHGPTVFMYEEG